MMFRSAHADEESGSDWDEYSPQATPLNTTPKRSTTPQAKKDTVHVNQDAETTPKKATAVDGGRPGFVKPVETELTSLATVATPPPRPQQTPPTTKYGVEATQELDNQLNEINDRESLVEQIHDRGNELEYTTVNEKSVNHLSPYFTPSHSFMGTLASKSERYSQRCSEEVFSTLRIITDFIIHFFLSCLHYLLYHVTNKLCCGLLHICTDALFKPFVHLCFNGVCWPLLSLLAQVAKAVAVIIEPLLGVVKILLSHLVHLARACRLVQVNINGREQLA